MKGRGKKAKEKGKHVSAIDAKERKDVMGSGGMIGEDNGCGGGRETTYNHE